MAANANQPRHDWALYSFLLAIMGLIIGGVGLLVTVTLPTVERPARSSKR